MARSSRNGSRAGRRCRKCGDPLPAGARRDARYCGNACRQADFRRRRHIGASDELAPVLGRPGPSESIDSSAQNHESIRARRILRPVAAVVSAVPVVDDHEHSPRLCAVCTERRYLEIRPAPRARVSAELVAARIRADGGSVWGAVNAFGISYRHALEIRAGWRGAGRLGEPVAYAAGGWINGRRNGWSVDRLRALPDLELEPAGERIRRHIRATA